LFDGYWNRRSVSIVVLLISLLIMTSMNLLWLVLLWSLHVSSMLLLNRLMLWLLDISSLMTMLWLSMTWSNYVLIWFSDIHGYWSGSSLLRVITVMMIFILFIKVDQYILSSKSRRNSYFLIIIIITVSVVSEIRFWN